MFNLATSSSSVSIRCLMGIIRLQSPGSACTNLSSQWRTHLHFPWPGYITSLPLILLHLSYIYIIGGGWACVCVSVGVCERKLRKLPVPVLIPSTVLSNYCLVHKLLLELVVEHLQASPSLKMNTANAHSKTDTFPEDIMLAGNTICLGFIIQAEIDHLLRHVPLGYSRYALKLSVLARHIW